MKLLRSIAILILAASTFVPGRRMMAETPAAPVDVTKEGWWLTPYKATKEWTIGVSYTDVSISYIAALQKAVQNKAKEMGVKIIEVDAKNDTNVELSNVENLLQQKIDVNVAQLPSPRNPAAISMASSRSLASMSV